MSGFEDPSDDSIFEEIMLAAGLKDKMISIDDLPVAPMDGRYVALDAREGQELRTSLLWAYTYAKSALQGSDADTVIAADRIALQIYHEICGYRNGAFMHSLFALEGADYFHIPGSDNEHINADFLTPSERLFGRIAGTAFSEYVTVNPEGVPRDAGRADSDGLIHLVGGMLFIREAVICEANPEGTGHVDRSYDEIFVPIHTNGLTWASAYPKL